MTKIYRAQFVIFLVSITSFTLYGQIASTKPKPADIKSCEEKPEARQFDFWLGEWEVTLQGQKVATSKISAIEGHCIILEQYAQPDGYTGQSFNFYNPMLGKWRQVWIDNVGNSSEFSGIFREGAIYYEGVTYSNGTKVLRKMTLFNLGPDKVRQLSHRSIDEGKTWNVNYDFLYVRRKE
jgi:hypothetical protein